jgi:hypothetical protein
MPIHRQRNIVRDTTLLSGWLFADLLLGLTVVFLMATPGGQPGPTPTPTPIPTPTLTSTPTNTPIPPPPTNTNTPEPTFTPEPTATPVKVTVVSQTSFTITLQVNQDLLLSNPTNEDDIAKEIQALGRCDRCSAAVQQEHTRIINEIYAQLDREGHLGKSAGIVLTFGAAPSANLNIGSRLSKMVNALLMSDTLKPIFQDAPTRQYIDTALPRGRVNVEVFFLGQAP